VGEGWAIDWLNSTAYQKFFSIIHKSTRSRNNIQLT
jgi:hypothetical protein